MLEVPQVKYSFELNKILFLGKIPQCFGCSLLKYASATTELLFLGKNKKKKQSKVKNKKAVGFIPEQKR